MRTVEGGMSVRQAACQLMIDYSCALKWMRQFRRKGNVQPKRQGGYRKSVLLPHTRGLLQYIEQKPDQTLAEIRQSLIQKGVRVGIATLWRFFQRHQISFKKDDACSRTGSRGDCTGTCSLGERSKENPRSETRADSI